MGAGEKIRVLVVDDEPSICRALTIALQRAGCDAITAQTGDAALALLGYLHVDVLVLDLRIHDMRGDTIFHIASGLQPHLRTSTMFMTGDVTERADILIRACGVPYVRKPFLLADITETVHALAPISHRASA